WPGLAFVVVLHRLDSVERAVAVDHYPKADVLHAEAGRSDVLRRVVGEALVIGVECLKNHASTSFAWRATSITPFSRRARKNCACGFSRLPECPSMTAPFLFGA